MVTVLSRTTEDKNARAISKVVPTWQAVEGTAVQMCPSVLATKAAPLGLAWGGKHLESSQLPDSTPIEIHRTDPSGMDDSMIHLKS